MNKINLTHNDVALECREMLTEIGLLFKNGLPKVLKVYPVARGGVPVAYMLKAQAAEFQLCNVRIVTEPKYCDVIVDDLLDSGATLNRYAEAYPSKPFIVMYDKPRKNMMNHWISLPWEIGKEVDHSAEDIPLRLLQYIGEDVTRGGLLETPQRYLKAWEHYTSGYNKDPRAVLKEFQDGAEKYNEMVLVKNIPVFSHCEHHLAPFYGVAHVAYIPNGKIVGLSKLARLVDIFMRRLQVQERLTSQIADTLDEVLSPVGVAVVLNCQHTCMIARGVQVQGSTTVTSTMLGAFREQPETRAEFMGLIKN